MEITNYFFMDIYNRIIELTSKLELAISYEDWSMVNDVRDDLLIISDESCIEFPLDQEDYD